jgi:hypothetical protein
MSVLDAIETATKPWWLRLLPYVLAVAAVLAALYAAYSFGVDTTTDHYKGVIAQTNADNAKATALAVEGARRDERKSAQDMHDIDTAIHEGLKNEINSRDAVIADLRAGTVGLRKRFTCPASPGTVVPKASTSTSGSDAAGQGGLQAADAEFLIRLADEADQVARRLQAAQAVVRKDRGQ